MLSDHASQTVDVSHREDFEHPHWRMDYTGARRHGERFVGPPHLGEGVRTARVTNATLIDVDPGRGAEVMREGDGSGRVLGPWAGRTSARGLGRGGGRIALADLLAFRRALDAATRRSVVTPLIVVACVATFIAMSAAGVPILWPNASHLVGWGANDGARV